MVEQQIRAILWNNDELRKPQYRSADAHPLSGHCYVASEAYFHLREDRNLKPHYVKHEGTTHWFLKDEDTGEVIDLTEEQFNEPPAHRNATACGFLTKEPSKRAQTVIDRVK